MNDLIDLNFDETKKPELTYKFTKSDLDHLIQRTIELYQMGSINYESTYDDVKIFIDKQPLMSIIVEENIPNKNDHTPTYGPPEKNDVMDSTFRSESPVSSKFFWRDKIRQLCQYYDIDICDVTLDDSITDLTSKLSRTMSEQCIKYLRDKEFFIECLEYDKDEGCGFQNAKTWHIYYSDERLDTTKKLDTGEPYKIAKCDECGNKKRLITQYSSAFYKASDEDINKFLDSIY